MFCHEITTRYLSENTASRLTVALTVMSMGTIAMAAKPDNVTQQEMALIPVYCPYTQSWDQYLRTSESIRWSKRLGPGFGAIHHYCWGQINLLRALRSSTPEQERKHLLHLVRSDYIYVVKNSPRDFILLPEIHTRIGEVELRLNLVNDANKSFAQARALKPDYWPGYSHWAEFLIGAGKRTEAKQLVKLGLEYSPSSRVLREQYRLLGGNSSEIIPRIIRPEPDSAAGDTAASEATQQPTRIQKADEASHSASPDK